MFALGTTLLPPGSKCVGMRGVCVGMRGYAWGMRGYAWGMRGHVQMSRLLSSARHMDDGIGAAPSCFHFRSQVGAALTSENAQEASKRSLVRVVGPRFQRAWGSLSFSEPGKLKLQRTEPGGA